jgi:D-sedoheptulose 7-phosphate isomerase
MKERIEAILLRTAAVHERLVEQSELIEDVALRLAEVFRAGGSVYVMGDGGSAADSQHLAGELVGRFQMERAPLPCVALSTDTSVLTALANDYGVESIFSKQVAAHVREGDAVVAISTSGNSPNVVAGIQEARRRGGLTIGLTGGDGGRLAELCEMAIVVPDDETPRIQEAHGTIVHLLCDVVERVLFGPGAEGDARAGGTVSDA